MSGKLLELEDASQGPRIFVRGQKKAIARSMRLLGEFTMLANAGLKMETLRDCVGGIKFFENAENLEKALFESVDTLNKAKWVYGFMTDLEVDNEAYRMMEDVIRRAQKHHGVETANLRGIMRNFDLPRIEYQ
ncbi:MAG: hypothetical protein GC136_02410 [Alphaproteobacteria bacterium]|nr:hypothetical protein [Alphaproteobacteria bacterium]